MARRAPKQDVQEALHVSEPRTKAAGTEAVAVSIQRALEQMSPLRATRALARVNHRSGFDCPGCAWPEENGRRRPAEFCENGAKAVAEEATERVADRAFFAAHSVEDLRSRSSYWLGQQGRLGEPVVLRPGSTHYEPIDWASAYALIAESLNGLDSPDQAVFYTSGRTSNEAAFLYQLLVRSFGTNNLPDCSNMCHESSGRALTHQIGIGKGSVSIDDIVDADLIVIAGQNPGSNHPRMLSTLEKAKQRGARVIAINPLPEAGLLGFKDPQSIGGILGHAKPIADDFLQIRVGGDLALFQGLGRLLLEREDASPGSVVDADFVAESTAGWAEYADHVRSVDLDEVIRATGLTRTQLEATADALVQSERTIACWAMGLTQHRHAVATIAELTNLLLMRGMIGKPGAGVCPVRGHSNVQGDRTMGIFEQMPESFSAALDAEFSISSPRAHGFDTVAAIRAMRDGQARVFVGMGGNFAAAAPDSDVTEAALMRCDLTVHVSTKLNRSHVVGGQTSVILPTLGRSDSDLLNGKRRSVTVEDSMSMVHLSTGRLRPVSDDLRSEPTIVCEIAEALFGPDHPVPWSTFARDYDSIRDSISRVVAGFEDFNRRVRSKNGIQLPHPPRDSRTFATDSGKANFVVSELEWVPTPPGRLVLQTMRSHDQYNTTIYGLDDRYRGIKGRRDVVLVNPDDICLLGFTAGDVVDVVSEWRSPDSGQVEERRVRGFTLVAYDIPRGNAAAYYPETNPLVPLDHTARGSNTPASKSIVVRLEATETPIGPVGPRASDD